MIGLKRLADRIAGLATGRALLAAAALMFGWSIYLALAGGVYVTVLGVRLSSREPWRPVALGILFTVAYVLVRRREIRRDLDWITSRIEARAGVLAVLVALAAGGAATSFSTQAASGSDAYGYVSQADLWVRRQLFVPQPLMDRLELPNRDSALAPLGYRPGDRPNTIIPTYAPGLPMVMAAAKVLFGACALYDVVPAFTVLLVLMTYLLGARVVGPAAGLAAAVLVASSPIVLYMCVWPMSDVPVGAAWTGTLAMAAGRRWRDVVVAGVLAALTVLIRPNLAPLLLVVGAGMLARLREPGQPRMATWSRVVVLSTIASIGVLFVAVYHNYLYGSPLNSGYPQGMFRLHHIVPNLQRYPRWLLHSQTAIVLLALVPLLPRRLASGRRLSIDAAIFIYGTILVTVVSYLPYIPFDEWWYLRFLIPMIPALLVATVLGGSAILGRAPRSWAPAAAVLVVVLLAVRGVRAGEQDHAFALRDAEQRYAWVGRYIGENTPPNAAIISMQHSGSTRYYGGRLTVRYDWIEDVDRLARDMERLGYKPYILLEVWERDGFKARFAAAGGVGTLDWPPSAEIEYPVRISLFDPAQRGRQPDQSLIPQRGLICDRHPSTMKP